MLVVLKVPPEARTVNTNESMEQATDRESTMVLVEKVVNSERT
jgi:hypothetical protein